MTSCLHGIEKIVSGGQTGVDRAALDAAMELGLAHGGWCPRGRRAEDGPIHHRYQLEETSTGDYAQRTEQNVLDSDGTLILYRERLQGGTLLTHRLAKQHGKPVFRARLDRTPSYARILDWFRFHNIKVLNVAGPRGSSHENLEIDAKLFLLKLFQSTAVLPSLDSPDA